MLPDQAAPALHLVRHGQSTWNVRGLVQGQNDEATLTDLGREQVIATADLLAGTASSRLLTSDLRRALQTAAIIGSATGLDPIRSSLLREQGLGVLEGLTSDQAGLEWDRAARRALEHHGESIPATSVRVEGGESLRDVLGRVGGILASPWVTDASGDVILVSHGDTIRVMLAHLLGDDFEQLEWRPVANGEIHSVYRATDGSIRHVSSPLAGSASVPGGAP